MIKDSHPLARQHSRALYDRATQCIPGGVNSPVRAFKAVGETPLFIQEAEGPFVIDADGKMNKLAGTDLNGLDRFEARKVAAAKLEEIGALVKEEDYNNSVGCNFS